MPQMRRGNAYTGFRGVDSEYDTFEFIEAIFSGVQGVRKSCNAVLCKVKYVNAMRECLYGFSGA